MCICGLLTGGLYECRPGKNRHSIIAFSTGSIAMEDYWTSYWWITWWI